MNGVTTLDTHIDNRWPNVAKHLKAGGYQTAMIGKWHLGEGKPHEPTGFDFWSALPGQGEYFDPVMIEMGEEITAPGYVTDVITDKSLDWLDKRDPDRPFFLMCHHKAPHRNFEPHPKNRDMFEGRDIKVPATYNADYANRARAAEAARMRLRMDLKYADLGLVQPEGGDEVGELCVPGSTDRRVPHPADPRGLVLIDRHTGENFTFETEEELALFKYQRYMKRYLATIHSIDESIGRLLYWLDEQGLAENTIVIYTSDQGFYLGEHGWFDKRFMYEESLQMPFLMRYPAAIAPGGVRKDEHHNAWAHYGLRNHRYKLIYWYNSDLGQPGAHGPDEPPEWELFDCEADPLELVNVADDPAFAEVYDDILSRLDAKMIAIGDIAEHDSAAARAARGLG